MGNNYIFTPTQPRMAVLQGQKTKLTMQSRQHSLLSCCTATCVGDSTMVGSKRSSSSQISLIKAACDRDRVYVGISDETGVHGHLLHSPTVSQTQEKIFQRIRHSKCFFLHLESRIYFASCFSFSRESGVLVCIFLELIY